MQNLRDQLLKAGLINEDQAKKVDPYKPTAPRAPRPQSDRPPRRDAGPSRRQEAPIPKLPPLAVPNNREFQRLEAKRQVELDRHIRELVLAAQLSWTTTDQTFYFVTRKNKLRRLELPKDVAERLERGELAVVERPDPGQIEHAVVPAETALKIIGLQERSVRFFNRTDGPVGFLTDEELAKRQQQEAQRSEAPDKVSAAGGEKEEGEAPGRSHPETLEHVPKVTDPDEATDLESEPEQDSDLESITRTAERTARSAVSADPGESDASEEGS